MKNVILNETKGNEESKKLHKILRYRSEGYDKIIAKYTNFPMIKLFIK